MPEPGSVVARRARRCPAARVGAAAGSRGHWSRNAGPTCQRPQGCAMPLEAKLRRRMQQLLAGVDDHDTRGPRLVDDAQRLWRRIQSFIERGLAGKTANADTGAAESDTEALEL